MIELMKKVSESIKIGPAVLDHIYRVFEIHSLSNPHIHKVNYSYATIDNSIHLGIILDFDACRVSSVNQLWKMDFICKS